MSNRLICNKGEEEGYVLRLYDYQLSTRQRTYEITLLER